jgi:DNA polymerase I-like protein with 3'-5' exonuclease and polymerase domains
LKVAPKNVLDPSVGAWLINPELDSYEFAELLAYFMKETDKSLGSSNVSRLLPDMLSCFRLWVSIEEELDKNDLKMPFSEEMKVAAILGRMEALGIAFDNTMLTKNRSKLERYIEELKMRAEKSIGHSVLLSSPMKVAQVIFDELGLEVEGTKSKKSTATKKHQSTSESVLMKLKAKHPFPALVLEFRHCQKLLNTYIDPLDKKATLYERKLRRNSSASDFLMKKLPRIHTTWCHLSTATGRLSSINPNMQNLPRAPISFHFEDDEEGDRQEEEFSINIRDSFTADEGKVLVAFDYSQIEMRVLAHMSKDKYLLQFFQEGKDIHKLIASRWLGKKPEEISSTERDRAKHIVYGILYGMGPHSLSEILKVKVDEASQFIKAFLGKFPNVATFLDESVKFAKKNKFVKTLSNRRRLLPFIGDPDHSLRSRSERQVWFLLEMTI